MSFQLNAYFRFVISSVFLVTIFSVEKYNCYAAPNPNSIRLMKNEELAPPAINPSHKCVNMHKRYSKIDGRCYTPGSKGPCGDNMLFYAYQESDIYGDCDCSHINEIPLVLDLNNSKCHQIYQQGYCPENQWLVYETAYEIICEDRKCPLSDKQVVFYNGKCVELFADDKTCSNKLERVRFVQNEVQPRCAEDNSVYNIGVPPLKCSPGYSTDVLGDCKRKMKFNPNGSKVQVTSEDRPWPEATTTFPVDGVR